MPMASLWEHLCLECEDLEAECLDSTSIMAALLFLVLRVTFSVSTSREQFLREGVRWCTFAKSALLFFIFTESFNSASTLSGSGLNFFPSQDSLTKKMCSSFDRSGNASNVVSGIT